MSSTAVVPSTQTTLSQTAAGKGSSSPLSSLSIPLPTLGRTPPRDTNTRVNTPSRAGWIHPRMDEVLRRRSATNFDASNMKMIFISVSFILLSLFVPNLLQSTLPTSWLHALQPYPAYALWVVRAVFTLSIAVAVAPLLRTPDACEDVPLTPQQRRLLGLPPMSRPATPQEQEQYVTPPRFSRSATPRSSSSSLRAEPTESPLSGRAAGFSGPFQQQPPGSASASPFGRYHHQRTGSGERRRLSFTTSNRSSPLSESLFDGSGSSFGSGAVNSTPTKVTSKASVGLNNKWLYEKGRASPRGSPNASRANLFS